MDIRRLSIEGVIDELSKENIQTVEVNIDTPEVLKTFLRDLELELEKKGYALTSFSFHAELSTDQTWTNFTAIPVVPDSG